MLDKEAKKEEASSHDETLSCLWTFLQESFKFMIFGFFKRCLIIIGILIEIKKLSPADTREYIFNEALAHDLRYFFKTILLCIRKCGENQNVKEILALDEYHVIVDHIVNSLNKAFDDQDLKSVSKEYEKTLNNVLSRFAVA